MEFQDLIGASYTGNDSSTKYLYKKNKEHFDNILTQIKRNNIIPLLGAGFSGAAYPGWATLLREMAAPFSGCTSKLEKHLSKGEFEEAASVLRDEMGEHEFLNELYSRFGDHTLPEAMKKISDERKLLPSIFRGPLVTTNFEQVIEEIYGRRIPVLCPHTDYQSPQTQRTLQSAASILFKLHGTIEGREHLILTKESYDAFYAPSSGKSVLVNTLKQAFSSRQVLFLGCSLETDRVLQVLKSCCENREYFALAELPEETENKSDPFSPLIRNEDGTENAVYRQRRQFMSAHHINCIWYPYHQFDALDVFLKELCNNLDSPTKKALSSTIPAARRELIGRDATIDEVYRRCTSGHTPVFVTGPGGIGKTEVCHSVLRRMERDGFSVLYVDVTDVTAPAVFCEAVAKAAGAPALQDEKAGDFSCYLTYAKEQVIAYPHGTLYLDNWESLWYAIQEEKIKIQLLEWMAGICTAGIPVLVSSRDCPTEYDVALFHHPLPALDRAKGEDRALFRAVYTQKRGHLSMEGELFEQLLRQLDGHPLSIVLTATQAARSSGWESVLEHWTQAKQKTANQRHSSLDAALRVSWDAVSDHPDCIRVWGLVALSRDTLPIAQLKTLDSSWEDTRWNDSIASLHDASLLDWSDDGTALQMLQPIKEAFFLLAKERDAMICFQDWHWHFKALLDVANNDHHPGRLTAHIAIVAQLPQLFYLLDYMISQYPAGKADNLIRFWYAAGNYFQFSSVHALPLFRKIMHFVKRNVSGELQEQCLAYLSGRTADLLQNLSQLEEAGRLYQKAERIYEKFQLNVALATTLLNHGNLLQRLGNFDSAMHFYECAQKLFEQESNQFGLANTYTLQADLFDRSGDIDQAMKLYRKAKYIYHQEGIQTGLARIYLRQADVLAHLNQFHPAIKLYRKAEAIYRQEQDEQGLANIYRGHADTLLRLGNCDDALSLYQQAEMLYRKQNDNLGLANTLKCQADLIGESELSQAMSLYQQAEELYLKERENLGLANILKNRGYLFYTSGQKEEGINSLLRALALYESERVPYSIATVCAYLALIYADSEEHHAEAPAMEQRAREIAEQLHPTERQDILRILGDTLNENS